MSWVESTYTASLCSAGPRYRGLGSVRNVLFPYLQYTRGKYKTVQSGTGENALVLNKTSQYRATHGKIRVIAVRATTMTMILSATRPEKERKRERERENEYSHRLLVTRVDVHDLQGVEVHNVQVRGPVCCKREMEMNRSLLKRVSGILSGG